MNSVDAHSITYFNFHKESNKEDPKFEVNDHIRISKYEDIFEKG